MIDEWKINLLDQLILRALDNGFNDMDFEGWAAMPMANRIKVVKVILENDPEASNIIFRKSFARAIWGQEPYHIVALGEMVKSFDGEKTEHDFQMQETVSTANFEWQLQQLVLADGRMEYLRDNT